MKMKSQNLVCYGYWWGKKKNKILVMFWIQNLFEKCEEKKFGIATFHVYYFESVSMKKNTLIVHYLLSFQRKSTLVIFC